MTYSQRAKDLVHAILEHPRVQGNQWNAAIWAEVYEIAQGFLEDEAAETEDSVAKRLERARLAALPLDEHLHTEHGIEGGEFRSDCWLCVEYANARDYREAQADGDSRDMAVPV